MATESRHLSALFCCLRARAGGHKNVNKWKHQLLQDAALFKRRNFFCGIFQKNHISLDWNFKCAKWLISANFTKYLGNSRNFHNFCSEKSTISIIIRVWKYRKYRTLDTAVLRYRFCNTAPRGIAAFADAYSRHVCKINITWTFLFPVWKVYKQRKHCIP